MARVKKNFLGEVRGKIGDVVYKKRGKTEYAASTPKARTDEVSPAETANRNRMKVAGKFAKAVKDVDVLKKIWESVEIEEYEDSEAINKITGINYKSFSPGKATEENKITPEGFNFPVKSVDCLESKVEVELNELPRRKGNEKLVFVLVMWFEKPRLNEYDYYTNECILKEAKGNGKRIIFELDENMKMKGTKYRDKIIYLALVVVDEDEKVVRWSSTFAKEVRWETPPRPSPLVKGRGHVKLPSSLVKGGDM